MGIAILWDNIEINYFKKIIKNHSLEEYNFNNLKLYIYQLNYQLI